MGIDIRLEREQKVARRHALACESGYTTCYGGFSSIDVIDTTGKTVKILLTVQFDYR